MLVASSYRAARANIVSRRSVGTRRGRRLSADEASDSDEYEWLEKYRTEGKLSVANAARFGDPRLFVYTEEGPLVYDGERGVDMTEIDVQEAILNSLIRQL